MAYSMSWTSEILGKLWRGSRYLTTSEITRWSWEVPQGAALQLKSAFTTPVGLYTFLGPLFSIQTAVATFQRLVARILDGLGELALAYISDIAILSQALEEHLFHGRAVLSRILSWGNSKGGKK